MSKFDFSGWATRNNLRCSDGRTIIKDAFKNNDGQTVPLVWNHQHNDPYNVLGHALLENREEGVYAYCSFNDTEAAQNAKLAVQHGDVCALSIYANQLKQQGGNVIHGAIREVSLVLAGANPGAYIETVISHSDNNDEESIIFTGDDLVLSHADEETKTEEIEKSEETEETEETEEVTEVAHSDEEDKKETVADVFDTLTDKQKDVVYAIIGEILDTKDENEEEKQGGKQEMKHNVFEQGLENNNNVLSHADQESIIAMAKTSGVGSFQDALSIYAENNQLKHGIDKIETLFPDYKDVYPGAPERITNDLGWVNAVMKGIHKSPISRIRTRQADTRGLDKKAKGYKKGEEKKYMGNIKLLSRTTDPQTIYIKDKLNRDDILDITDFDVVNYQYLTMKDKMYEEIAMAIMVGDGREEGEADKISETHVRSIWNDDELYTIHADVDIAAAKKELQGSNTSVYFSENFIYSEAIVNASLYAREQYKGKGGLDFFCTPHLLNVMLLARDRNGHRMYSSKEDLARALNVENIYTAEQFEGLTRTAADGKVKKLLGIFVNLSNYHAGSTKGGEITKFSQFDIDFNQEKYLLETRMSGALVRIKSAIVLEEPVEAPVEPEEVEE